MASKKFLPPSIVNFDKTPPDRAEGIPNKKIKRPGMRVAVLRFHLRVSIKKDVTTSISDIAEVRAASDRSTKKITENTVQPGICENTIGILLNTRPGPASGAMP